MDEADGESGISSGDETDDDEGPGTINAAVPDPQIEESDFPSLADIVKDLSMLTNTSSYVKSTIPKSIAPEI
eukprot:5608692-Ditylum_brightwellii.AAC.1